VSLNIFNQGVSRVTAAGGGTVQFVENSKVPGTVSSLASRAQRGGASSTTFLPENGMKYDAFAFSYHTGLAKQMNIPNRPADGMVRGTIVINVSGHDGAERAKDFAKTNSYNVCITLPDGKQIRMNNIPRNNPNSEEYATKIPIEFPFTDGKVTVEAWPTGSAGVFGYIEGRRYEVHMGKDQFDVGKARTAAAEWERQHPNPREGEASPRPYGDF
jgi:hypothetical protein